MSSCPLCRQYGVFSLVQHVVWCEPILRRIKGAAS